MNLELFILGGYGQFVWPAFFFTFVCCYSLYLKTSKELQKQEKIFLNEFKDSKTIVVEIDKEKEVTKEALLGRSAF